jgi:serine/threonine protein kinase
MEAVSLKFTLVNMSMYTTTHHHDYPLPYMCMLAQVDHPNCIKLFAVYITTRKVYIVTELVTGGELLDRYVCPAINQQTIAWALLPLTSPLCIGNDSDSLTPSLIRSPIHSLIHSLLQSD